MKKSIRERVKQYTTLCLKQLLTAAACVLVLFLCSKTAYAASVSINTTNFPDDTFRAYVKENFDRNGDGVLTDAERNALTAIDVDDMGISSLKGIECFEKLEYLWCSSNNLSSLDLSRNTELFYLECEYNNLSSLDLSRNTDLEDLFCYNNKLNGLDLSENASLASLVCHSNNLSNLDVSKNTALTYLECTGNNLSSLDVSKNTALEYLYCYDNNLSSLDLSNNTRLSTICITSQSVPVVYSTSGD